jgi:hypothetical protein
MNPGPPVHVPVQLDFSKTATIPLSPGIPKRGHHHIDPDLDRVEGTDQSPW